jgi:hypothetical protein
MLSMAVVVVPVVREVQAGLEEQEARVVLEELVVPVVVDQVLVVCYRVCFPL